MAHHITWSDVHKGHNLCDRSGEVIGLVKSLHQAARAAGREKATEGYAECESKLPGLTIPLFIPFDAFRDCDGKCCYLNINKDELSRKGWDRKPTNL